MKRILFYLSALLILAACSSSRQGPHNGQAVNIGYGSQERDQLTTSVSTVKASKQTQTYSNIFEMIQGRCPGVQVQGERIIIRGIGTMNSSSDPLILVDGVETQNIGLLDPHDIYSVDVLKDASASIYGLKGANGVILITTRTGRQAKSQKAR